jgi:hypothetical protein
MLTICARSPARPLARSPARPLARRDAARSARDAAQSVSAKRHATHGAAQSARGTSQRRAVMASQRKSAIGKCSKIKDLRRVRADFGRATPHPGGPAGGRMILTPLQGGGLKFFAHQNFLLKNFCIVSNIYTHVCSSCIVKFDYVIANLLTSAML